MSAQLTSTLPSQHALTAREVLGLATEDQHEWSRLRGLQYARLVEGVRLRMIAHGFAALPTVWLFKHMASAAQALGWLAILACVLAYSAVCDRGLADTERRSMTREEFHRQAGASGLVALVWVAPVAWFTHHAPPTIRLELWTILAMLMTIKAVVIPAVPLASMVFTAIVGIATVLGFAGSGDWAMAVIALLFVVTIMLGSIETSRNFLASRLAEAGVAARDEVVSLLLREHQEGDADWLWEIDVHRRVRGCSRQFANALRREPDEIDGMGFFGLVAGSGWKNDVIDPSLRQLFERIRHRESFSQHVARIEVEGRTCWWELSGAPLFDESGAFDGYRGVGSDVTARRESSEKMARMARYDALTGLPNRQMLTDTLIGALAAATAPASGPRAVPPCALLMIDLDRFKAVNDTLGHVIGDRLLEQVSARLQVLSGEQVCCGRLGGDEFAVVISPVASPAMVGDIAAALIASLSQPYHVEGHVLHVGASVGSAIGPRDGDSVAALMHSADLALYRVKGAGGGVHCAYEPAMRAQADQRRAIEVSLAHALERGEFALAWQPIVSAQDGQVASLEALLRWHSPEHGAVDPERFLAIAEDTRAIGPIGKWVIGEAVAEAASWPVPLACAINLSGEQLLDPELVPTLVAIMATAGLPPQRLVFEINEAAIARDPVVTRETIGRLVALGCKVMLDDFGRDTASLSLVRNLPFAGVKIDRGFVAMAARGEPEGIALVGSAVALAHGLGIAAVAEGVETAAEASAMREVGCTHMQGFCHARPMDAAGVSAMFSQNERLRA